MIRHGKQNGWLRLEPDAQRTWAQFHSVDLKKVKPVSIAGRGVGLVASDTITVEESMPVLLTVPRDLILSRERVLEHAKVDQDYREVLESLGQFGSNDWHNLLGHETPRGAILSFLLLQACTANAGLSARVGVHCPLTDYVKSLPSEHLPTFWTLSELALLQGTTLAPAIASKMKSLHREYDLLKTCAERTRWWTIAHRHIEFDDWLQVDAMYRSRALDFPGIGHCMAPCIDLANHEAGEKTLAIYEVDPDHGDAVLMLRDGKSVKANDEITITYGDEKGACEMLFSYGFLESGRTSAETLFLSLDIPDADPLRLAKLQVADCAPGIKLIDTGDGEIDWKGDFVWLLCANAEDGLKFEVARTVDDEEETHAFFGTEQLNGGAAQLYRLLGKSELWEVFRLRAVAILQQRVFDQLQVLYGSQEELQARDHGEETDISDRVFEQTMRLRQLEFELLEQAYEEFEKQKIELASSPVVQRYLETQRSQGETEEELMVSEDFS